MNEQKDMAVERNSKSSKPPKDMLSNIMMGLVFIAAGTVFFLYEQHFIYDWLWWMALAIGGLLFVEAIVRITVTRFQRPVTGTLIWSIVLVGFSVCQLFDIDDWWPFILIGIGAALVLQALREHQPS